MAVLTRFVIDLVTEEELSERRTSVLAREMTENLHTLGVETEDEAHKEVDKYTHAHVHEVVDERCSFCVDLSLDYRNAQAVIDGDV